MIYRILVIIVVLTSITSCTETNEDCSKKKLTQHERDSILAETDLPGAGIAKRAIEASDSSSARAKRLDEQSD